MSTKKRSLPCACEKNNKKAKTLTQSSSSIVEFFLKRLKSETDGDSFRIPVEKGEVSFDGWDFEWRITGTGENTVLVLMNTRWKDPELSIESFQHNARKAFHQRSQEIDDAILSSRKDQREISLKDDLDEDGLMALMIEQRQLFREQDRRAKLKKIPYERDRVCRRFIVKKDHRSSITHAGKTVEFVWKDVEPLTLVEEYEFEDTLTMLTPKEF